MSKSIFMLTPLEIGKKGLTLCFLMDIILMSNMGQLTTIFIFNNLSINNIGVIVLN